MCQGFSHFTGFLHHFVLAKLATTIINVSPVPVCFMHIIHCALWLPSLDLMDLSVCETVCYVCFRRCFMVFH